MRWERKDWLMVFVLTIRLRFFSRLYGGVSNCLGSVPGFYGDEGSVLFGFLSSL